MTASLRTAAAVCLLALALASCNAQPASYQGWIEADLIFVAPDEVGRVQTLSVQEGDTVKTGAPLFTVDDDLQEADLAQVKASLTNAQQTYDRASMLLKTSAGTQKDFDAAQAALRDAQARLNSAQTRLTRRSVFSPVSGTVEEVYYRPGEMVPADRPVVALLPPGNIKVRFFVPEAVLPHIAYGDTVKIACDGCAGDLTARVSFIAKQSEYTPPVIYSREERARLVFLIEAIPENPGAVRVGQPVDVTLVPPPAQTAQETPR
ncbi:MAG TPA: efflux RND transporter periplasmic adaptor subunit [Xanthobacteraceae bacterium]|jgi:HlyD family secretion protein|nr:efflux RND transporter periplasmic adaptor subunit [Xanthobacteraceae bacterium]